LVCNRSSIKKVNTHKLVEKEDEGGRSKDRWRGPKFGEGKL